MKATRILTLILFSTVSSLRADVGDTLDLTNGYIAEGVAGTYSDGEFSLSAKESTRLYDSTKGWAVNGDSLGDSLMCWAHTTSNMLQYWQSYYGVFYKGNKELPYGSDYTRTYRSQWAHIPDVTGPDPMRLNVMKRFIETGWTNSAGKVFEGTDWFFTWTSASAGGGYYSDYFGSYNSSTDYQPQTATVTEVSSLKNLTETLLPAMGITRQADGSYIQTEAGLIAHLNVGADVADKFSAHTLTCYGFTLDENGMIKSLVYADSDNNKLNGTAMDESYVYTPTLEQAYVKVEGDKIMLYTDATLETALTYNSDYHYYLGAVTGINTPESLRNMLEEYSSADEALVWNGSATEWKAQQTDTNTLPDQSTGWDVLVNGDSIEEQHKGYYHSYAEDNRAVLLDAHGMNGMTDEPRDITIVGTITPGSITVENGGNYRLKAENEATIAGNGDVRINDNGKLISELSLGSRNISAAKGGHFSYALSSDTVLTGQISADSGSSVQFRNNSTSGDVTYSYSMDSRSQADATVQALKGKLIIGDKQDIHGTHLDLLYALNSTLTLEELTLYSGTSLNAYNEILVTETFSALRNAQVAAIVPQMKWHLNLSQAHTLEMETAVDMGGNNLKLGNSVKQLTLSSDMFPMVAYSESNELKAVLFTNITALDLGNGIVTSGTWTASSYFKHAAITNDTKLVLEEGILSLQGLSIPEPAGTSLNLLALTLLATRRRRK